MQSRVVKSRRTFGFAGLDVSRASALAGPPGADHARCFYANASRSRGRRRETFAQSAEARDEFLTDAIRLSRLCSELSTWGPTS